MKKVREKGGCAYGNNVETVFPDIKRAGNFACRNSKQARIERKRETEKRAQMLRRVYAKLKDIEEIVKDIL